MIRIEPPIHPAPSQGWCQTCGTMHMLPAEPALPYCLELMGMLSQNGSLAMDLSSSADPRLSTAALFGEARGKMFGVLLCRDSRDATVVLRGFSGQYNGLWEIAGWVPPLFDVAVYSTVYTPGELRVKALSQKIAALAPEFEEKNRLRRERKTLSQELMQKIFTLYRLTNFAGEIRTLAEIFATRRGIPTGTGDCCAPKLLGYAAANGLTPIGMAEFYWGLENRSSSRQHGRFYPPCEEKCTPLLGFLLCGI